MRVSRLPAALWFASGVAVATADAATVIRIVPPDRATFAVGQRFDLRVEATNDAGAGSPPPRGLRVFVDGNEVTARNLLDVGVAGERGAGGTGATGADLPERDRASGAPPHTTNFLLRDVAFAQPGTVRIEARTADGARAAVQVEVFEWEAADATRPRARHVVFFLGDGMGIAHRTAARIVSRGVTGGRANGRLAMDRLEVTGQVMTSALNAVITDSAPGMSAYATGNKANNNQQGVFPDNTSGDAFDNPRVEYIGAMLRRLRGPGFGVGLVTTADVTDATPAANAVHTSNRYAYAGIAARYVDERDLNGIRVLMGGGSRHFTPEANARGGRRDGRDLVAAFTGAGFAHLSTGSQVQALLAAREPPPAALLGLFHPSHLPVAFDKVGAGRYSDELTTDRGAAFRDQPMLDDLTRLALRSLEASSPQGFYLMVEAASIDKASHAVDAERTIWDTIELDNAVAVALEFAARTNGDDDPTNDTLVIVTADHECGGLSLIGVGNARYAPAAIGRAVRDYVANLRYAPEQVLDLETNYEVDAKGFPVHPDPLRKLLLGWAAAPDRYENWISNRRSVEPSVLERRPGRDGGADRPLAVANPARDSDQPTSDNRTVEGVPIPGFLVPGTMENGEHSCTPEEGCPGDTTATPHTFSGHTASDVVLSATGPGALQFTGTYDNTAVMVKMLRAVSGRHGDRPGER